MINLRISKDLTKEEKVFLVNSRINNAIEFREDPFVWGEKDYWATPEELFSKGSGDCEDVAVAKYLILKMFDIPSVLMYCYKGQHAHMVCVCDGMVLDFPETVIRPQSESGLEEVFKFDENHLYVRDRVESSRKNLSMWNDVLNRLYNT